MFRGSYFHTIDPKGRLIIPAKFREILKEGGGDSAVISRMDGCVVVYSLEGWAEIERKILSMAKKDEKMRNFRRVFIGGSHEIQLDKQGRILIPPPLRQYANLEKETVLMGVTDHFEIASKDTWDEATKKLEEDLKDDDFNEQIADLGL